MKGLNYFSEVRNASSLNNFKSGIENFKRDSLKMEIIGICHIMNY